jgi:hypothetical protein
LSGKEKAALLVAGEKINWRGKKKVPHPKVVSNNQPHPTSPFHPPILLPFPSFFFPSLSFIFYQGYFLKTLSLFQKTWPLKWREWSTLRFTTFRGMFYPFFLSPAGHKRINEEKTMLIILSPG